MSVQEVKNICEKYVASNAQFQTQTYCNDMGMTSSTNRVFSFSGIAEQIDTGNPVVLHIKGHWEYEGRVYHQSTKGHFLLVTGYDENGLYVCDPGSKNNTENGPIPKEAFSGYGVTDLYYRELSYTGG